MSDVSLRDEILNDIGYFQRNECTRGELADAFLKRLAAHDQALRDRLLAAMPEVTMNELLEAKQFPKKVATYKKMVWMQNYYRDKYTAAIASVLNDKEK